jgi:heat shock 70kDa protein 1/2/6/8
MTDIQNSCIGIDLGTTYSCVASYKSNGHVEVIPNGNGNRITPSYVAFNGNERIIGDVAKNNVGKNCENTIYDVKRIMGKKYSDKSVKDDIKHLSYKIIDNSDRPFVSVNYMNEEKHFSPEEISSMILSEMKQIAESHLGRPVKNAVITVPAYFNDSQRQATKDAGTIAGLNVLRMINEPTAAAIAYGLDKNTERIVMIYDIGGGTLDVTILNMDNGMFDVKSTSGDTHLGGEDFDNNLKDYCFMSFCEKHILPEFSEEKMGYVFKILEIKNHSELYTQGSNKIKNILRKIESVDISDKEYVEYFEALLVVNKLYENPKIMRRLKTQCEMAKKILSTVASTEISYENFYDGNDLCVNMTRTRFENICDKEFKRCLEPISSALKDAKFSAENIDDVVLIGGSTRIPKIRQLLEEMFPGKLKSSINPDEAVACGAAIQAAILNNQSDEVIDGIVLVDVTPLSLGIETSGGAMEVMIARNSSIPCESKKIFSTFSENQPAVTIKVYEGERLETRHNNLLGSFSLTNIPPMPKGRPRIEVIFKVDPNGIMTVSAKELSTQVESNITVKNEKGRLSDKTIEKMIEEAKKYSDNDKEFKRRIDSINSLENYISVTKNILSKEDFKNFIDENKFKDFTILINDVQTWFDKNHEDTTITYEQFNEKYKMIEEEILPLYDSFSKKTKKQPTSV